MKELGLRRSGRRPRAVMGRDAVVSALLPLPLPLLLLLCLSLLSSSAGELRVRAERAFSTGPR